jgi:steroid delta-isomerase-like uncharacterized protein
VSSSDERAALAADRSDIEQLLSRYCQIVDALDYDRLTDVMADDVDVRYPQIDEPTVVLQGCADVIAWLKADEAMMALGGRPLHFVGGTVIDVDGDTARSTSYGRYAPGSPYAASFSAEYRRAPNWLITRLHVEMFDYSPPSDAASPISVVETFIRQFFNEHDVSCLDRTWAEECTFHLPGGGQYSGLDTHRRTLVDLLDAMPDLEVETQEMFANGELVGGLYECRGTHSGELLGVPATGKYLKWTGINIYRVRESRIVEEWSGDDVLAMMQQLGLPIPQLGEA